MSRLAASWRYRRIFFGVTWLAAGVVAGCVDLIPVEPPPTQPATLTLSIHFGEATRAPGPIGSLARITAVLEPGVDAGGRSREVADETLRLWDRAVLPVERGARGQRLYSLDLLLEPDRLTSDPIEILPPVVGGVTLPAPIAITWQSFWRVDADDIVLPRDADLVLRVGSNGASTSPTPSFRRWSLALFRSDGWFSQGNEGLPPPEIRIPAQFLGGPGPLLPILNIHQSVEVPILRGEYVARIDLAQEIRWAARIEEAPTDVPR